MFFFCPESVASVAAHFNDRGRRVCLSQPWTAAESEISGFQRNVEIVSTCFLFFVLFREVDDILSLDAAFMFPIVAGAARGGAL